MTNEWLNGGASVVGSSHIETKTVCQDSFEIAYSHDKSWVAVAVCDGAGSARKSEIGSQLVSKAFASKLILLSNEFDTKKPGFWINDFLIQQVLNVREELRKIANSDNLDDYHTTLIACLVGKTGGFVIHIGDGSLVGGVAKQDQEVLWLDSERFISEPQNGEYSNETYFITEPNWIKNIRVTPLPPLDWFLIGTDGGSAFYLNQLNSEKQEFISSFIRDIRLIPPKNWSERIKEILQDKKADPITGDDKTLVFFAKRNFVEAKADLAFKNTAKQETIQTPKKPAEIPEPKVGTSKVNLKTTNKLPLKYRFLSLVFLLLSLLAGIGVHLYMGSR